MASNLIKITVEQANEFLVQKGVSFPQCPLCKSSKFSWYSADEGNVLFFEKRVRFPEGGVRVDDYRAIATSFCDNCGYSIEFDGIVLIAWQRGRAEGTADEQRS